MTLPSTPVVVDNHNRFHLIIDGYDLSPWVINADLNVGGSMEDAPAGNISSEVKSAGLKSRTLTVSLRGDPRLDTVLPTLLGFGKILLIEYGPDGNAPGKPLHYQRFMSPGYGKTRSTEKSPIAIDVEFAGTGEPIYDSTGEPPATF
jgi:hypothetical protein